MCVTRANIVDLKMYCNRHHTNITLSRSSLLINKYLYLSYHYSYAMKLFSAIITAVACICIVAAAVDEVEDDIAIQSSNTKSISKQLVVEGRTLRGRGLARTRANRNRVYSPFYRMGGSKSSKSKFNLYYSSNSKSSSTKSSSKSSSSKSSKSCTAKSSKSSSTKSSSKSKSSTPKSSTSKSSTSKSSKSSSCKSSGNNNKKKNRKNRKKKLRRREPWGN